MPTPDQFLGPYYPIEKPSDGGADMTRLPGREGMADGDIIYVHVKIINTHDEPCKDVDVEIWQPNAAGRYIHPNDTNPAPLDPNFDGYATRKTDAEGCFEFKSVKPGSYPVVDDFWRPPHIHFQFTGTYDRLITQMYFPNEPLNDKDPVLQVAWANESLVCEMIDAGKGQEPGAKNVYWTVRLIRG